MKQFFNRQFWQLCTALALGIYIGYCFFRPAIPISELQRFPQKYADRWIYVRGRVGGSFGWSSVKMFQITDPSDGASIVVRTDRTILPATGEVMRLRVRVEEPFARVITLSEKRQAWWNFLVIPGF